MSGLPNHGATLGRACELDTTTWIWTWNKKDNYKLFCGPTLKTLYIITSEHKSKPGYDKLQAIADKYGIPADDISGALYSTKNPRSRGGRANYIVYSTDRYTDKNEKYIHSFEIPPIVRCDNVRKPKIIAITGGDFRITKEGIVG